MGTQRARVNTRTRRNGERGQALILFVALFSILLALAAFSIDQGLWLNHRRIAQKDADAAARAGAAQYIKDLAAYDTASSAALAMASANGAPTVVAAATFKPTDGACLNTNNADSTCARQDCPTIGSVIPDAPSIEIAVPRPAPGLFIRALGAGDADNIGARSIACVGSVTKVQIGDKSALPLAAYSDDTSANSCFDHSANPPAVRIGYQCTIKNGALGNQSRGYFRPPPAGECLDNGSPPKPGDIVDGVDFTCAVNTGSACDPDNTDCIGSFNGTVGQNVADDFHGRLTRTAANDCPTGSANPGSSAFADIFDYADGRHGPVLGPPGLNGDPNVNVETGAVDPFGTLYTHKSCQTPRTALIVISDGGEENVRGFAAVYIVGCFLDDAPLTNAINDCDAAAFAPNELAQGHVELRGVIVNVFLTEEAAGDIGSISTYGPLALETTR